MTLQKKHICFNAIVDPNWHAGTIYIFNCITALSLLPEAERATIFVSLVTRNTRDIPEDIKVKVDRIYTDTIFHLIYYKVIKLVPSWLRFGFFNFRKIDFYYPGGNLPKKWIFNWGGWIPDFQYKYLPHLFSEKEYALREQRSLHAANNAPTLVFSSRCAINDYIKFYPNQVGNEFLLQFVSNANINWLKQDPLTIQQKHNLPDSFFIVCNQFWKHKDHVTIIDTISLLKKRGIHITVVCTGATTDFRDPTYYQSLLDKAKQLDVEQEFRILGFISREDQIQLIRRSLAIIQPSLFEGWSTVVEDGRSLGKTIFLSDFPVHMEQNPPYAYFFKQQDAVQLAQLVETHLPELTIGPDKIREETAYKQNQELMIAFGKRIKEMAIR